MGKRKEKKEREGKGVSWVVGWVGRVEGWGMGEGEGRTFHVFVETSSHDDSFGCKFGETVSEGKK